MPTGVKLPPIEQAAGSMSVLPTGTVLVKNADTGVAVSIYNDRGLTSLLSSSGLTTVTRGQTVGYSAAGVTWAIYVTPSAPGQVQQGPFYFEANLGTVSADVSVFNTRLTSVERGSVFLGAPSGSDDTAVVQAAIDTAQTARASVFFQPGTYLVTGLTVAKDKRVALRGMGIGFVGGDGGTRIKRSGTGTGILLDAEGTAAPVGDLNDTTQRVRLELYDLELHGNDTAGKVLVVYRGQQCIFERVRVRSAAAIGAHFTQMFNSRASACFFSYSGSGDTTPAVLIDGTNEGAAAGTNTFHLTDCEWETNAGTDLIVDGFDSTMPSVGVMLTGAKMERSSGAWPLIRTTNAQIQVANSYLFLGSGTNNHLIEIGQAGTVPSILSNLRLGQGGSPTYLIKHNTGALTVSAVHGEATVGTAVLRIESAVSIGKSIVRALTGTDLTKLVSDARGITGRAGQIALTLPVVFNDVAAVEKVGTGAAGWRFSHGSSTPVCIGQIVMPPNIPQSAACSLIVRWVPKTTTGGNVVIKAISKDNTASDDLTSGGTTATVTTAAGTTANIVKESGPTPGITTNPGHIVRVMFQRDGANAADTYLDDIVIVGVDVLVTAIP